MTTKRRSSYSTIPPTATIKIQSTSVPASFLNQVYPTTASYAFIDNIFDATMATSASGTVYGAGIDCRNGCPVSVLDIHGNYIWNSHAPTTTAAGGANTQAYFSGADQGASFPWGTNTYERPWLCESNRTAADRARLHHIRKHDDVHERGRCDGEHDAERRRDGKGLPLAGGMHGRSVLPHVVERHCLLESEWSGSDGERWIDHEAVHAVTPRSATRYVVDDRDRHSVMSSSVRSLPIVAIVAIAMVAACGRVDFTPVAEGSAVGDATMSGDAGVSGLIAWWKLDEGVGPVAHDSVGSDDGMLQGSMGPPAWVPGSPATRCRSMGMRALSRSARPRTSRTSRRSRSARGSSPPRSARPARRPATSITAT